MDECEESKDPVKSKGRQTNPVSVTIVNFGPTLPPTFPVNLLKSRVTLLSFVPIFFNLGCCIACGIFLDWYWYCFSMILFGILTSELSCFTIGSRDLFFIHPGPAIGSPEGDGFMRSNKGVMILRGEKSAVHSVTRGRFVLLFAKTRTKTDLESCNGPESSPGGDMGRKVEPEHIGLCAMSLVVQFLAQLLLIPQGTLFGQILFLSSLAISWMYNQYLSSMDRNKIQRQLLMQVLKGTTIDRYLLGNWTSMTVFALLAANPPNPQELLNELITNDTEVWKKWKAWVLNHLEHKLSFDCPPDFYNWGLDPGDRQWLSTYIQDAKDAFTGFWLTTLVNRKTKSYWILWTMFFK